MSVGDDWAHIPQMFLTCDAVSLQGALPKTKQSMKRSPLALAQRAVNALHQRITYLKKESNHSSYFT
eukprot:1141041-Pelagomonas_calceolata.AAC.11